MQLKKQSKPAGTSATAIDSTQLVGRKQTSGSFECVSNYSCIFYIHLVWRDLKKPRFNAMLFARCQHHIRFASGFAYAPFNAMVTKISKWSRIQDSCRITPKIESLVGYAMPDIPSKFQKGLFITFWVILLTHRQTSKQANRQTKSDKNITSLAEVKIKDPVQVHPCGKQAAPDSTLTQLWSAKSRTASVMHRCKGMIVTCVVRKSRLLNTNHLLQQCCPTFLTPRAT